MKSSLKATTLGLLFILLSLGVATIPKPAHAAYDGGNIIDNVMLLKSSTMNASDIQAFLTNMSSGLAYRTFNFDCASTGSSNQYYISAGAPCGQTVSASTIIYYAAQIYGINPQAILATVQKEQSLVTTANPTQWQIDHAMGYGCPTSSGCTASDFLYQVDNGVWALRFHMERARSNMTWWRTETSWTCGVETEFYKPNLYPGQNINFYDEDGVFYRTHFITNAATAAFYCYTPHAYNNPAGLYGLPKYGTTGRYYSGSYNFVYWFEKWFVSTHAILPELEKRYNEIPSYIGEVTQAGYCDTGHTACWQEFNNGYIIYNPQTGAWESLGPIRDRWSQTGYQNGKMGYPTGPVTITSDNKTSWQPYQNGYIVWSEQTGAWESKGAIRDYWAKLDYQAGVMGYPTGPVITTSDSKTSWQSYQNGYIIWGDNSGAWESKGAIRDRWAQLGYQNGTAGFPIDNERYDPNTNTWSQRYQNGVIYYSDPLGAWFTK